MNLEKIRFLKDDLIFLLKHLAPDAKGAWGAMNGHQMVEHLVDVVRHASGKLELASINKGERLEKARTFMFSDQPFAENIRNPYMSETPPPPRKPTIQASIEKLQQELNYFFDVFEKKPGFTTLNAFFGDLDFDGNVHLLYKHSRHHLRQFGLLK